MTDTEASTPDLSEFDALVKHNGTVCWYSRVDKALSLGDMAKLDLAMERGYSGPVIARWLKERGVTVDAGTVKRHVNRECRCG